jgi:divalent metal cation (Fe/Co/Zn/Cd) transporter
MGLLTSSWWLLTLGSYYFVLSLVRFVVLRTKSKERFTAKFTGWMLMLLSIPLVGTVILSVVRDRGLELHMIVMIAMAAYAFTKITLATINLIKARRSTSATLITLRNISFADAFVSIFALQRSMLVSFEGMREREILMMNAALGSAVCVIVFLLGGNLLRSKKALFKTLNH